MVDSTNLADEPAADLVAYYCDGIYAISEASVRAWFPNAIPVAISAIGTDCGVVGDVEPGCMTPAQAAAWVRRRRAAGVDPTLYVNDSNWAAARAACAAAGIEAPYWWEAHYDNLAVLTPGTVAKQYQNSAMTGGHFDRSVVADFWPGVDNVFGPGGGSIGEDMNADQDARLALVEQFVFRIYNLLKHNQDWEQVPPVAGTPGDGAPAAIGQAGGGTEPVEPKTVSGTFTGTVA